MSRPFFRIAAVALLLGTSANALAGKKRVTPDVVEDALAYATTDRDRAIELLQQTLDQRPDDLVELHLAEQLRLAGRADDAHEHFTALADHARSPADRSAAELGLALLDAESGHRPRALPVLESSDEKAALATQNADRYLQLAIRAANQQDPKAVGSASKKALAYAKEDPEVLARVQETLSAMAEGRPPPTVADNGNGDPLERAEKAYLEGDLEAARKHAEKVASGSDEAAEQARGLLRALDGAAVNPRHVTVLLPLSGKYEVVGGQVRDALLFGYGTAPVELDVVDSGGTAESAVAALEKAVLEDGAIAVVGALLTDETDAVVAAAEELHVPLISLSQSYEDSGTWTFQAMYTRADQIDALLTYVSKEQDMTAFAMFSPDNAFGQHAAELFTAGVAERGLQITTQATYSPDETSLISYAKKLGRRTGSLAELKRKVAEQGGNPDTVVLPPVVDFQGIFLPESANRTPVAAAALAYEEFPMGTYVPQGPNKEVRLLGLSTWNTVSLVTQGNEYTRNSLFPDVFSATVAGESDPFVVAYRGATSRTPSSLEAAVVDAGKLLAAAARTNPDHRGAMRRALLEARVSDSVTGADGFDPETLHAHRQMRILTITRDTLEQVGTVEQIE
ncbi:MAG: penicillin-binding protein activator [Alphaproteobacteria bacterium]|nr:penicillin-binding protein activator [Alphaproteobacteria bacterium]